MKTEHAPSEVYGRRKNGRYYPLGCQWDGFPMDGVWLVQNGKTSQRCLIGLNERVPIFALNYRQHEQGIVDAVQKREKETDGVSLNDIARIACDYFAHVAARQIEK